MPLIALRVFRNPTHQIQRGLAFLLVLFSLTGMLSSAWAADEDKSIDLRLFGQNVVGDYDGCHLAFWQHNKTPGSDKFSYVFYAPYNDGEELPAWMKVGKTVYELTRQDGVQTDQPELEELRLYRDPDATFTVLVEVKEQHVADNNIFVDKAKLTITQSKHFPFVISVKGGVVCPQLEDTQDNSADAGSGLYGDAIQLGEALEFDALAAVPAGVLQSVKRDAPDCQPANTTGFGRRFAITDEMTLWEVPCNLYARTGSSVFVTALNSNPAYSNVLILPAVPDHGDGDDFYEIRAPQVTPQTAMVRSEYYDGDGSCGSYSSYQLRVVEGEALEFFLIEYREKPTCDGVQGEARNFPLIYSAQ
ncbi:hypothetical protein [Cohaesibacter celericrescens]|uniref:hypothetical protein n=1 Tax=Cohaesibacter celericrescens TaxID=2067669 RepID=UPI0035656EB4